MEQRGQVALVAGAGRAIGRAIARALGAAGVQVVVVARSRPEIDAMAGESSQGEVVVVAHQNPGRPPSQRA